MFYLLFNLNSSSLSVAYSTLGGKGGGNEQQGSVARGERSGIGGGGGALDSPLFPLAGDETRTKSSYEEGTGEL